MKSVRESVGTSETVRSGSSSSSSSSARTTTSRTASSRRTSSRSRSCSRANVSRSASSIEPRSSASSRNALRKSVVMLRCCSFRGGTRRWPDREVAQPYATRRVKRRARHVYSRVLRWTAISVRVLVYRGSALARAFQQLPSRGEDMARVSDILRGKGNEVLQIEATETVFDAIKRMVEANVGSILVTDGGQIVGILTERDYLRKITLEGRTSRDTQVGEIMSSPLVYVTPQTTIEECMAVMTDRRIRHLPVVEEDDVVGVVSIGDVVKYQSREQSFQIQYLTDYISGR